MNTTAISTSINNDVVHIGTISGLFLDLSYNLMLFEDANKSPYIYSQT
jgi:hypothetical protein